MAITLVKQRPGILPVRDETVVLAGEERFYKPSLWKGHFRDASAINEVKRDSTLDGTTVFAIFSEVSAWKGSSGIGDDVRQRITELITRAKRSIVISFGSPYILSHFKEADMLISAYEATEESQKAVIRCLKGEMRFKGELPVKLNL